MSNIEEQNRQLKYIELSGDIIEQKTKEMGRKPKCAVITFGCQMLSAT